MSQVRAGLELGLVLHEPGSRKASVSSLPASLHHISDCASLLGSAAIGVLGKVNAFMSGLIIRTDKIWEEYDSIPGGYLVVLMSKWLHK